MLLMFKVKNYTSFKDETILDLRATSYVQHPSHVINSNEKIKLLKTTALYGANASGKSNFISAMFFFEKYIFSQFLTKKENDDFERQEERTVKFEPFLLSKNNIDASEFDIIFIKNGKQYQYGFECTSNEVLNEWYYIDDKKVYDRNGTNDITYGKKYEKMLSIYKKLPKERLYISVLEYFLDDNSRNEILNDFVEFFKKDYNVLSAIILESTVKKLASSVMISKKLYKDKEYRDKIEKYLKLIDVGIERLEVIKETTKNKKLKKNIDEEILYTVHKVYDDEGIIVGENFFELREESSGTLRFLAYIQNIVDMIDNGGIFIVDELSSRLHPLLTKFIVDIFQTNKNTKAQLVFTTHDVSLLNNNQFRRDEVVLIDKNEKGESTLYPLSNLKVREDATFSKDYLQGKYGAIPILNYDEIFGGDDIG